VRERLRWIGVARLLGRRRGQVQELTPGLDCFGAIAAGEQAVVADAMETFGEDMSEKATEEFADVERHAGVAAGSFGRSIERPCRKRRLARFKQRTLDQIYSRRGLINRITLMAAEIGDQIVNILERRLAAMRVELQKLEGQGESR
jgi:hypothetical protein